MREWGAKEAILRDLQQLQRDRRRHFVPALAVVTFGLVGFVMLRARSDLWEQPMLDLVAQLSLWALALIVYPAIGLGLLFPSRAMRAGLIVLGAAVVATVGRTWSMGAERTTWAWLSWDHCSITVYAGGALLLLLSFFSGAFLQRHRSAGVVWLGASMALAGFGLVTWACPARFLGHVVPSHAAAALAVLCLGTVAGLLVRRFERHPS